MRFASLGSGSEGNALLVEAEAGGACLMVDCGFGIREVRRRLARLQCDPARLQAILVTHEHSDHVGGVFRLAASLGIPVYLTHGTLRGVRDTLGARTVLLDATRPIEIAGLQIEPFTVPHDAREPVQYVIDGGDSRLGVLTDIGHPTAHLPDVLGRLTALVLETNHDPELLAASDYPPHLKRRISGHYGHLANEASAALLASLDRSRLRQVAAAHLSRQNNRPDLAQAALAPVLGCTPNEILVATQDDGLDWANA